MNELFNLNIEIFFKCFTLLCNKVKMYFEFKNSLFLNDDL